MTNQINQIQATYNLLEDRIRLTIKTVEGQVYLAWITRRYLNLLLPVLHGQHPTTGDGFFDEKSALVHQAEKEQSALSGDYQSQYEAPENPDYPLGEEPILLTQITFKDIDTESALFILAPESGPGIQLPFNPELLGALLKIFAQAMQAAHWQLELNTILEMPKEARLQ